MRIGILGGTFDPIHEGHLALARAALKQFQLDRVVFVPAFQPPFAKFHSLTPADKRFEMVRLAISGEPSFEISDCEIKRGGVSYTVDTIRYFRQKYPSPHELFFIIGGDWAERLSEWKDIGTIFSLSYFVVAERPGYKFEKLPSQVKILDFAPLDISATKIRESFSRGDKTIRSIPEKVKNFICANCLYGSGGKS